MAKITPVDYVQGISGKVSGKSSGYFYQSKQTGKTYYREREETYQANQSPRQKWNSAAFAYAHRELRKIEADPMQKEQMEKDYEQSNHRAPNGKSYTTAHAWKFNCLLHEYKQANPFENIFWETEIVWKSSVCQFLYDCFWKKYLQNPWKSSTFAAKIAKTCIETLF